MSWRELRSHLGCWSRGTMSIVWLIYYTSSDLSFMVGVYSTLHHAIDLLYDIRFVTYMWSTWYYVHCLIVLSPRSMRFKPLLKLLWWFNTCKKLDKCLHILGFKPPSLYHLTPSYVTLYMSSYQAIWRFDTFK